jgi:hypothetical protein
MDMEKYDTLCELPKDFLDPTKQGGQIQISETLWALFGDHLAKPMAQTLWQNYFNDLQTYELEVCKGNGMPVLLF